MRKRAGFTLLEVIYCIAIIAIISAIMTPVFRSAKHSAQITASISNLHQMHIALLLYQGNQGSGGQYNSLASMGLPADFEQGYDLIRELSLYKSPCGLNPSWSKEPVQIEYEYFAMTSDTPPDEAIRKFQENTVMFTDMNCADHGDPLHSDFLPHRGLGVQLSGTLLNLNRPGDYLEQRWWSNNTIQ